MKYLLAVFTIFYSCNTPNTPVQPNASPSATVAEQLIICPDGNTQYDLDSIPSNLFSINKNRDEVCGHWFPEDEITPLGNYVKYLISNDSCCLSNLYLEWGNATFKNIECLGDLRLFHPRLYPRFSAESTNYLFLESAASGGLPAIGWLLSVYPLHQGEKIQTYDIFGLGTFDPQSLTLLREVEKPAGTYFLEAYNIKTKRTKKIHFKNRLPVYFTDLMHPTDHDWGIDSISITPQTILIRVTSFDDSDGITDETVLLPNDIK